MKSVILVYLLIMCIALLCGLGFTHLFVWMFSAGPFPNLNLITEGLGIVSGIVLILNILFGFKNE